MSANEIWARYVRYIGAGAVAAAGIITVVRGLPSMVDAIHGGRTRDADEQGALNLPLFHGRIAIFPAAS